MPASHDVVPQEQPVNIRLLRLQEEIFSVCELYFGYTPQIPLPIVDGLKDEKSRKSFCRSFGLIWHQVKTVEQVFTNPCVAAAIDFFIRLARGSDILADEWDLLNDNRQPVSLSPRFLHFRTLRTETTFKDSRGTLQTKPIALYMLDLPNSNVPWKLAVKTALDALVICRLDQNLDEHGIVEFLLTNGIPFHTLRPSRMVLRTPNVSRPCLLPLRRPKDYKFESRDYLAYQERCHTILNNPRGRAALMAGHFMWRLALRSVRWETVHNGPSGWSPHLGEMLVVNDPSTNTEFIDDQLSPDEQDALCGTYHCATG